MIDVSTVLLAALGVVIPIGGLLILIGMVEMCMLPGVMADRKMRITVVLVSLFFVYALVVGVLKLVSLS